MSLLRDQDGNKEGTAKAKEGTAKEKKGTAKVKEETANTRNGIVRMRMQGTTICFDE